MVAQMFSLGYILATPDLIKALYAVDPKQMPESVVLELARRHMAGDWGDVDEMSREANELALELELRLVSRYTTDKGVSLSIATEWDRSLTIASLTEAE
jgi:hypothetical protein